MEQIIETLEFGTGIYSASSLSVEVVDRSTLDSLRADVAMQNLVIIFAPYDCEGNNYTSCHFLQTYKCTGMILLVGARRR